MSEEEKEEWLTKQNDPIIVYKAVRKSIKNGRFYPLFEQRDKPFKKGRNTLTPGQVTYRKRWSCSTVQRYGYYADFSYVPCFHFFLSQHAAHYTWRDLYPSVLKCEVRKKDVTVVGWQNRGASTSDYTIVATAFKILGEV